MKILILFSILLVCNCTNLLAQCENYKSSEFLVTLYKTEYDTIKRNYVLADRQVFYYRNEITIKRKNGYTGTLRLKISTSADGREGTFKLLDPTGTYQDIINGLGEFNITGENLKRENKNEEFTNNTYIKIEVQSGNDCWFEVVRYINQIELIFVDLFKVKSPLLYIPQGDLGNFSLTKFSPSISGPLVQYNLKNPQRKFNYWSFDFLLTVTPNSNKDSVATKTTYSLSTGLILDASGWLQIGAVYDFKAEGALLVIGLRPEALVKLLGKDPD